jgi:hypothetical protein
MKLARPLLLTLGALALGFLFVRFFLSQLDAGGGRGGDAGRQPAAVVLAPPPGFAMLEQGPMSRPAAAGELASRLYDHPGVSRMGVELRAAGGRSLWLADSGADTLEERSAGAAGTRLSTVWRGGLLARLRWAQLHDGAPEPPGMPPPERMNLYH